MGAIISLNNDLNYGLQATQSIFSRNCAERNLASKGVYWYRRYSWKQGKKLVAAFVLPLLLAILILMKGVPVNGPIMVGPSQWRPVRPASRSAATMRPGVRSQFVLLIQRQQLNRYPSPAYLDPEL